MKFVSTRGKCAATGLSAAIAAGLAPDGGLYVPAMRPRFASDDFADCDSLATVASRLLAPFFEGDALAPELDAICAETFTFDAPLRALATPHDFVLELFHGPSAAFKDFGARFLAACMRRLPRGSDAPLTILVATSGDTGAAVGAAFADAPGFRVVILYPDGRVSKRQAHQLGAFAGNVRALRVAGSFDDCQRLVKQVFADEDLRERVPVSSANSISLGRLLPQMAYFAHAALAHRQAQGTLLNFVVPTGNLGNAFACMLANAMDVGAPSNFERLRWLYPDDERLRREFCVDAIGDEAIATTIRDRHACHSEVFCPHTATAIRTLEALRQEGAGGDWAVAATAHPAKFEGIVEPLIGGAVEVPPALAELLARRSHAQSMPADYAALRAMLLGT